jgi:phenylalanyl-tRNA synthetase beta chain
VNVSIKWLSALLGREIQPVDAAHRLAMLGAAVDAIEPLHEQLNGVVIGLVERVEKHPNADRLTVCQVFDGSHTIEVVCGAPNVNVGSKYPYAPVGLELPGGLKLTARKIRGVKSNGMLLSEREMELGTDHEGIMELATDAEPGTEFVTALNLADTRLELDVTANRPDLLCHKGVARELAAALGATVRLESFPNAPPLGETPRRTTGVGPVGGVEVSIEDTAGCPRYLAAVIRGVTIGPSPNWLQARLRSVGARPINNVVDATNYILYELNQPLHAFDLAKVRRDKIVVRAARPGEHMLTLDGESREFEAGMTLICDGEGPVAVGGVMGGANSEVSESTTDILLECAKFDPKRIRATRKALCMNTEASYRFERGTDTQAMPEVMQRAVQLIRAVAGGEEPESPVDVYPKPAKSPTVFLRPERVEHLLGMPVPKSEIERHLVSVGFVVAPKSDRLAVQIPGWRPDVSREVDLIEEIARLKGYDEFPVEMRPFRPSNVPDDPIELVKAGVRRVLTGLGLNEARSISLVSQASELGQAVQNPMSVEEAFLRESLLKGLTKAAERNWSVRERDIRLFEIGNVFQSNGPGIQPRETLMLAGVVSGSRIPNHWTSADSAQDYDLWDLKQILTVAASQSGLELRLVGAESGWVLEDAEAGKRGWGGLMSAERPAWAAPLFGFEVELVGGERRGPRYRPPPSTPPVERDLALVLPRGVHADDVEVVVRDASGELLETTDLFDEYTSSDLAGRSVAWRLVFRARERTLKDKEVDRIVERILKRLREQLGVERRQA